jgi:5-methylcytosine-specific restriction endonuclease McrA
MKRSGFLKRRTPLRKVSTVPIAKQKKQLWHLCRAIIFGRYGNTCYCCGGLDLHGSNLHLGHFIPSSVCSTEVRYSLENLRPSCYRCNIHLSGNWPAYERHLIADGIDVTALKRRNEITKGMKADIIWFQNKIIEYQAIYEGIASH